MPHGRVLLERERPDERQAQAEAGRTVRVLVPGEGPEQLSAERRVDAGAVIHHRQRIPRRGRSHGDPDRAVAGCPGVLLRVVQQVLQDLVHGVRIEPAARKGLGRLQLEASALGLDGRRELGKRILDHFREVACLGPHVQSRALEPRETQHVGHDATQPVNLVGDPPGILPLLGRIAGAVGEHLAVELQTCEWSAQLVGQRRGELRTLPRQPFRLKDEADQQRPCQQDRGGAAEERPPEPDHLGHRGQCRRHVA